MQKKCLSGRKGFSLIELVIYIAIFTVSAIFLVAILTSITRIQTREGSAGEVNRQIGFVGDTLKQMVQNSSLVDMTFGTGTSTLRLRMATSTNDPTLMYLSGTTVYLKQGSLDPVALTSSDVIVDNFLVTPYQNPGGTTIVQLDLSMTYNAGNPTARLTRSLETSVARVSAAQFDSSVYPTAAGTLDLGTATYQWRNGYFSGTLDVDGQTTFGASVGGATVLKSYGNIGFSTSTYGIVFVTPGGSCLLMTLTNTGAVATSSVACP